MQGVQSAGRRAYQNPGKVPTILGFPVLHGEGYFGLVLEYRVQARRLQGQSTRRTDSLSFFTYTWEFPKIRGTLFW